MTTFKERIKSNKYTKNIAHIIHAPIVSIKVFSERYPMYKRETRESFECLNSINTSSPKVFFCGVPTHNNMGDLAQAYCIRKWIEENYKVYEKIELKAFPFYNTKFQNKFQKIVGANDIFIIQSGYCTNEKHYNHFMHRYLVSTFINNQILVMPQTVNFQKESEGYKTGTIYNNHKHLLFLARDKKSYQFSKKYFNKTKIELFPDIVTTLIGSVRSEVERNGVLFCVRNDGEKKYSDEQIDKLKDDIIQKGYKCEVTDTNSLLSFDEVNKNFEYEFNKMLDLFSTFQVVITDRYHGTIFSMITNTPVIVLATNDHKVKTGTEWFNGIYEGSFVNGNSTKEALTYSIEVIKRDKRINNKPYFKNNYYDKLKMMFEHINVKE